ncbi:hypothetical protein J2S74_004257 [Evansella vedderi]|uniref:DUF4166 domain-containing protein n=1 Tax=Evansella vedderi TaxID=38282 RepID=A0ABU0A0R9_9BACI|nr:DUF4166 domain-containing protein [Evansella vedderi]MDQ0256835.1 hypothetical protein [Evansella vedderi]
MKSIYERVLGDNFHQLHPLLQRKFSLHSESEEIAIGEGTMTYIQGGKSWMRPLFSLGAARHLFFPERGTNIPFKIENAAYKDPFGRETVAWIRRFYFPKITRAFDATMIYSEQKHGIIDFLGNKQRLISPLNFYVTETGGLNIVSEIPYLWLGGMRVHSPKWAGPTAQIKEEVIEGSEVSIHVEVRHPLFGLLIEYSGSFHLSFISTRNLKERKDFFPGRYEKRE